ncbi:hypothetical protein ACFFHI_26875 [Streptomyces palmae]|uniref:hypothetical protein n=1 Tax=Streptomyces palmae TaxID=1701085 RepID=UPI0035E7D365
MPTPHGPRGGMAFSADELRVLRRALAIALQPTTAFALPSPDRAEEVQDCLRLAHAVDAAVHEGGRLRAFLLEELARYRAALPGAAAGYLSQLRSALSAGYVPRPEDLAALRGLCADASGAREATRRAALLGRCERLAEQQVRARLSRRLTPRTTSTPASLPVRHPRRPVEALAAAPGPLLPHSRSATPGTADPATTVPVGPPATTAPAAADRTAAPQGAADPATAPGRPRAGGRARLLALPGGLADEGARQEAARPGPAPVPGGGCAAAGKPGTGAPQNTPKPQPGQKPAAPEREKGPGRRAPSPGRPVPTPAEVFPPKRRPAPPAEGRTDRPGLAELPGTELVARSA